MKETGALHGLLTVLLILIAGAAAAEKQCPFAAQSPRGHMKPFGQHTRRWLRVESRYDEVSAEAFYDEYVRPSKPVVIRGGIADWPAVKRWPNLTYLGDLTGDTVLTADWRGVYKDHEYLTAHAIRRSVTMKEYIRRMNSENIYMDTPPTSEMLGDMMLPQTTNCEYFIHRMRSPSFFFNSGKSNTDIHIDGCETLFFQVSGSRLWLMTPPQYAPYMYSGEEYFHPHMGISAVNQRAVNLTEFPKMAKAVMYAAMVHPGDLIYVPEAWFHNVMAKGNPNIATTIFFDSSNCEKVYASSPDAEYVQACDRHRRLFLPRKIKCPKLLPRGTTFNDVARLYGKVNKKLRASQGSGKLQDHLKRLERVKRKGLMTKRLHDGSHLPRMVLDANMEPLLASLPDKAKSVLQIHYRLFAPRSEDVPALAEHLARFGVERSSVSFMLTVPHHVTGAGPDAVGRWLDEAVSRFGAYPVGAVDLVLMEAPPCVPPSAEAQDCDRDGAIDAARLAAWRLLEDRQRAGVIRHLGVKDVSAAELKALQAAARAAIVVVSLRLDPLYRQMVLRRAARAAGAAVMAHSVTGSGWVRDGLAAENPVFRLESVMFKVFGNTGSLFDAFYVWALGKGFFVMPERTDNGVMAEINHEGLFQMILERNIYAPIVDEIAKLVPGDPGPRSGQAQEQEDD